MMKHSIGIYSGTFDPIHQGHITFAKTALRISNLSEIVFLPEPKPREKQNVTTIDRRVALIKKAISDIPGFSVLDPTSEQFSVERTLPVLRDLFRDASLTLLVGSDVVRTFPHRWKGLDVLLREASLAIGMRSGDQPEEIVEIIDKLQKEYDISINYTLIQTPVSHIASSQIRSATKH